MNDTMKRQVLASFMLYGLVLLCVALYWPGLYSAFIFDDEPNLSPLAHIQDDARKMVNFSLDGIASRLGRPLSLASFAVQAYAWPDHPEIFKYVNLMIHLLCGVLIAWLLVLLFRLSAVPRLQQQGLWLAMAATGVWLLHPFQVSTVLYVVQRMTQLATLFTLISLVAYVSGRANLAAQRYKRGWLQVSLAIMIGLPLAVLSKENGILLFLYILVLEYTLLRTVATARGWKIWSWIFIYTPTLLIIAYFIQSIPVFQRDYSIRDFTMAERLLTEARILLDYISKIFYPLPTHFGLFHDDYAPSRGWLSPPQTLLSVLLIVGLAGLALWRRQRWPVFAFAVLWFLAAHALESSFIGLVLYFEHRNYLALLGPVVGFLYFLASLYERGKILPVLRFSVSLMAGLWLIAVPVVMSSEVRLWSKPLQQAYLWAEQRPLSRYAQSHAASMFSRVGNYAQAVSYYRHMVEVFPHTPAPYLLWLGVACDNAELMPDMGRVEDSIRNAREGDTAVVSGMDFIAREQLAGRCILLDIDTIDRLYSLLLDNSGVRAYHGELRYRFAMFHALHKDYARALDISLSLASSGNIDFQRERLIWMIMAQRYSEARAYIADIRARLNPRSAYLHEKFLTDTAHFIDELSQLSAPAESE
jgi:protein O-mannosyl-transferase